MRFSRLYELTEEFRSQYKGFEFAEADQTVVGIALSVRKTLSGWWNSVKPKAIKPTMRKPHQLVLELDGLAQIPMFR